MHPIMTAWLEGVRIEKQQPNPNWAGSEVRVFNWRKRITEADEWLYDLMALPLSVR